MNNIDKNIIETPDIDSSTDDYALRFKGEAGKWLLEVQGQGTLELLNGLNNNLKVLDVGGGHGQLTEILLEKKYDVTVFGSDESCKKRINDFIEQGKVKFDIGNLLELPYDDNSFDVVISYRMLTHLKGWKKFISEITRVSKKTVIVDFPSIRSINILTDVLFALKKNIEKNTRFYKVFKEGDIIAEFVKCRYNPYVKYPQFFLPMVLHRFLKNKNVSSKLENLSRSLKLTYYLGSPILYRFDKTSAESA